MKQKLINAFVFIFFLFTFLVLQHSDARLLASSDHQVEEKVNHNKIIREGSFVETNDNIDLMGSEKCDDEDEECMKRRMVAEAHLDYIYTQNHKP